MRFLFCFLLLSLSNLEAQQDELTPEFIKWTRASDGETIEAKVISIAGEKAVFELKSGKRHTLDMSVFTTADREKLAKLAATNQPETKVKIPSKMTKDLTLKNPSEDEYRKALTELGFKWGQVNGLSTAMRNSSDDSVLSKVQINDSDIQKGFQTANFTFLHAGELSVSEVVQLGEFFFETEARKDFSNWLTANLKAVKITGSPIHNRIVYVSTRKSKDPEKKFTEVSIMPYNEQTALVLEMMPK